MLIAWFFGKHIGSGCKKSDPLTQSPGSLEFILKKKKSYKKEKDIYCVVISDSEKLECRWPTMDK